MVYVGVIGTGYWGKNHARIFKELENEGVIEGVEICDVDEKRVSELGKNFGVSYTTDYMSWVDDPRIQAVSIVTPSATHYDVAKTFLEVGKDVFIEKPMTMDSKEARDLVKISGENGGVLMAGHIFRYHPAVLELKRRIDLGELGRIYFLTSDRLAVGVPRKDMGVMYALGIHEMDMFCYLLNAEYPRYITAVVGNYLQTDIEETALMILEFEDGVKGFAMESWLMPVYGKKRDLVVVGSEKTARIDYLKPQELEMFDVRIEKHEDAGDVQFRLESEQSTIIPLEYKEPLKEELMHFIKCIESRSKPLSDGMAGVRAIEMIEAAFQSVKLKSTIEFRKKPENE